jgi:DNA-binding transcriptional LysR family regulator
MELRHLRYFVAVAEEGSLTVAAERRLHTAQPSLSRQIRDLEHEVGTQVLIRSTPSNSPMPAASFSTTRALRWRRSRPPAKPQGGRRDR